MSDFKFNCPHCQQSLEAPAEMIGQQIDCPTCNKPITLPSSEPKQATFSTPSFSSFDVSAAPPSTASLLQSAIRWYKVQSLAIRILIAYIGLPVTIFVLLFRIQSKWLRRIALFVVIEGLLIALQIVMRNDLISTATSIEELWVQLFLVRVLLGALPAWLVHWNVRNLRRKYGLPNGGLPSALPVIIFFLPGIGLTIYSNWRYELHQHRKQALPNQAEPSAGGNAAPPRASA